MARVLVVDDSAIVRRSVAERITRNGHDVVAVGSGEEAIERALRESFDLVVSDVRMGAMTGVQLCRVLRSDPSTADLPVVLLTASDDPRSRFWGRHAGADAYLAKEGTFEALLPTIERLLASKPQRTREAPRPSRVDAASRVSAVMDHHLFEAVLAAEARKLMEHVGDRNAFVRAATTLLGEVIGAPYLSIVVHGPEGPTSALFARGDAAACADEATIAAFDLPHRAEPPWIAGEGAGKLPSGAPTPGETEWFTLVVSGETLGEIRLHAGGKRVANDDRRSAQLLAEALAPVVKSMFLFEETQRLAQTDGLTGLLNRRTMASRLEYEGLRSKRYENPLSVVLIDVDRFKSINDRYGHASGDTVLRAIARVLTTCVRNVDAVGRWGGEEFLLLLPECDRAGAHVVAERIRASVASLEPFMDGPEHVTVSCGVATRTDAAPDAIALVAKADAALYRAKDLGRDRVVLDG